MKPKPKPKRITVVGTLNALYWLSYSAYLVSDRMFLFKPEQAETLRVLWGKKVQVILDEETNYLQQIEVVE